MKEKFFACICLSLILISLLFFPSSVGMDTNLSNGARAGVENVGLPCLDELRYKVLETEGEQVEALLAGEVDMILGPTSRENVTKVTNAGYTQTWDLNSHFGFFPINCRDVFPDEVADGSFGRNPGDPNAPLNDSSFRLAMSYVFGMDRKNASIHDYYLSSSGSAGAFGLQYAIPPAQSEWLNPAATMPNTNYTKAWEILQAANYAVNKTDGRLYNPNATPVRNLTVHYAATSRFWQYVAGDFVGYMNEFMNHIGATKSPTFTLKPENWTTLVYSLLVYHDFDIAAIGLTGLGGFVDWLWDLLNSANIGPWQWNFVGIVDEGLDHLTETIKTSLNRAEIREASFAVQEKFIQDSLPWFPVLSQYHIATYHPDLQNIIAMDTCGSDGCEMNWMLLHWKDTPSGGNVTRTISGEPTNLNPLYENTSDGWRILGNAYQGLVIVDPTDLGHDMPWISYKMEYDYWTSPESNVSKGMKVTFYLRNDVFWQDGIQVTAQDVKYGWETLKKYKPERYSSVWNNLVYAETDGDFKVTAYLKEPSLTSPYGLAGTALLCPKHIWQKVDQKIETGEWTSPQDFEPWKISYKNWTGNDPPTEYPFMKALVGCGPYIFDSYYPAVKTYTTKRYNQFWVDSPVKAAVDAYYKVEAKSSLQYNVIVQNLGAKISGELATATVDLRIYEDDISVRNITGITLAPFRDITLGPYSTASLQMGTHIIKVEVVEEGTTIDTYTHTVRASGRPRMDSLLIEYFENSSALFNALKNGEVDLTDLTLTQEQMDLVFNDTNIQAAISPAFGMYEFDFNNNATVPTYPDWTNPTAYKGFRQGIACLVNKSHIVNEICSYSHRIDTPIPRPNGDWWVDWSVSQYDPYGDLLGNYPYEYNSIAAANYFNQSGFLEGNTPNPSYDPSFPGSAQYIRKHPETDEDLEPLIFYIRNDSSSSSHPHAGRLEAGRVLRDNLRKMGIPVNAIEANFSICVTKVMMEGDYHIYTGGWGWEAPPAKGLDLLVRYSSEYITEGIMGNYPQFRNATYDEWVRKTVYPSDLTLAREAALKCQRILVEEAACVWLWSPSYVMGYRNIYGVVNPRGGRIDNPWTFLTMRNDTRTEIRYGLSYAPTSLNIITDYVPECLDRIYDTLLSYCPYDKSPVRGGETMPWMAEDWEIGVWESPYEPGENLTKLTFYLRDGITWHDGVDLTSTDVKFTIEYLQELGSNTTLYSCVSDVHHVTTPNAHTVVVYEKVLNILTLDRIGTLPILPKHIFQDITDVSGYTPGSNEGHAASETLIGSGAWRYVNHSSSMLYLAANRDYFMETPPKAEIDFRYDWEMGCWAVDAMDATMIREAYGSSGNGIPHMKWESGCDIAKGDCTVDIYDIVTLSLEYNATWGRSAKRDITPLPTDTAIYIEPSQNPVVVGENLTIHVKLAELTKLSGLQFKLNYDNSKLDFLDLELNQIFGDDTFEAKNEVNQIEGLIWISITTPGPTFPTFQLVSGNTTVATITFNATRPSGSFIDLWNTKLATYGTPGLTCQLMTHKTIDRGVMVGVSTPAGEDVTVAPAENTEVTFAETITPGVTTLNITEQPSTEFVSVDCHVIETTATYTGNIALQFPYDEEEDEEYMKIWLWNESSRTWLDVTTYVDTDENIVYGVAPHLSMFGVTCDLGVAGSVVKEGETTVSVPAAPPPIELPPTLAVLNYYVIETTTTYEGQLTVHLPYEGVPSEEETFIQIWLWNESSEVWLDVTTYVDTDENIVYGVAPHLSMFGVTSLKPSPQGIAFVGAEYSKTIVGEGFNVDMNFTIQNQGDFTEIFDVIVYCNSTKLENFSLVELSPTAKINLSFTWATAGWAKGKYAIRTCGDLICWITVTIPGDVDGDFDVDIYDIVKICVAYGSEIGEPKYDANCDIDGDGDVDIYDVVIACTHYGQEDP